MPIYEYYCKNCEKEFEVLQKISAQPLTECKFCSGDVEKMVSNSSFKFKGGGWYITDYKKNTKATKDTKVNKKVINDKSKSNQEKNAETKQTNEPRKAS